MNRLSFLKSVFVIAAAPTVIIEAAKPKVLTEQDVIMMKLNHMVKKIRPKGIAIDIDAIQQLNLNQSMYETIHLIQTKYYHIL